MGAENVPLEALKTEIIELKVTWFAGEKFRTNTHLFHGENL